MVNLISLRIRIMDTLFMLKLDEPFRDQEIFKIFLFSTVQIWVLRIKKFFFADLSSYFPPWIQEAKILPIQRIRILSTVYNLDKKVPNIIVAAGGRSNDTSILIYCLQELTNN